MGAPIYMLRVEIDGHFHGSPDVPKPWAARVTGPCLKFGLAREFVDRMNDWRDAGKAWSGNTYGVVATFPLREGAMYEISRLRGNSSKRHVAREFVWAEGGKLHKRTADDALAYADGDTGPATFLRVAEPERDAVEPTSVAEVLGLGMPRPAPFVSDDGTRRYRLRDGCVYEVRNPAASEPVRLVLAEDGRVSTLTQAEAWARLQTRAAS